MKKIFLILFIVCYLFKAQLLFAQRIDSDFDPIPLKAPVQCKCTYQITQVIQDQESEYYNPDANPTDTFETSFTAEVTYLSGSKITDELINATCQATALKKGLGNAQCKDSNKVPLTTKIEDEFKLQAPTLQVRIPGFDKFSDPPEMSDDSGRAYFPWMGEYIRAIYNFGLTAISILAVLMIIISGIKIIFSGLGGDRKEAYKRITQSIIGLILAWGSYSLLYMINPQLVNLRSLGVTLIEPLTIDTEGAPETNPSVGYTFTSSFNISSCSLNKYPEYAKKNELFGTTAGLCLGWVKKSLADACGSIPDVTNSNGAWDVASKFVSGGKFHPCDLDGIKDGDLVFMTSMGSNWIGLWENFRTGNNGCTIADASSKPVTIKSGVAQPTTPVFRSPKGMPPVTHIGVYYNGKIYHQIGPVVEDPLILKKLTNKTRPSKPYWAKNNILLTGYFIHEEAEFIAGYGTW